jgi:hypothetical protein
MALPVMTVPLIHPVELKDWSAQTLSVSSQTLPSVHEVAVHWQTEPAQTGVSPVQAGVQVGASHLPLVQVFPEGQDVSLHLQVVPTQSGVSPLQPGLQLLASQLPLMQDELLPQDVAVHSHFPALEHVGVGSLQLGVQVAPPVPPPSSTPASTPIFR